MYENIDMKKTGILLKETIEKAGYTVKDIKKILISYYWENNSSGNSLFWRNHL